MTGLRSGPPFDFALLRGRIVVVLFFVPPYPKQETCLLRHSEEHPFWHSEERSDACPEPRREESPVCRFVPR